MDAQSVTADGGETTTRETLRRSGHALHKPGLSSPVISKHDKACTYGPGNQNGRVGGVGCAMPCVPDTGELC